MEPIKEVVKITAESSAGFSHLWQWLIGSIGGALVWIWAHLTGRLKTLEMSIVTHAKLDRHIEDEEAKFDLLFSKHDELSRTMTAVRESVARIEGKLSSNHNWQDHADGR